MRGNGGREGEGEWKEGERGKVEERREGEWKEKI